MFDLSNKRVLVTGGTGGIGGAIVNSFLSLGAVVFTTSTSDEKLNLFIQNVDIKYRDRLFGSVINLENIEEVTNLVKICVDKIGGLDILICNAGATKDSLAMRMNISDWNYIINVNLTSTFLLNREAIKYMIRNKYGRIINVSSVVGFTGNAGQSNYIASKSGIVGMTKSLALEVASRGLTVNAIAPGFIDTSMTDKMTQDAKDIIKKNIPLGYCGHPQDIANGVIFLASDEARYITGSTLHINGGMFCN
jgi:3-oxoacyl-[acyl-carrier protein] reductase